MKICLNENSFIVLFSFLAKMPLVTQIFIFCSSQNNSIRLSTQWLLLFKICFCYLFPVQKRLSYTFCKDGSDFRFNFSAEAVVQNKESVNDEVGDVESVNDESFNNCQSLRN